MWQPRRSGRPGPLVAMPRLPLHDVRPGQRLARAIVSHAGVVLVQPGAELTPAILDRLRSLGVDAVEVAGEPEEATEVSIEARVEEVDARFAGHEDDRWMMALKAIVLRQLGVGGRDGE